VIDLHRNTPFQTVAVGSLPRDQWVYDLVTDRREGRVSESESDRLLDRAVPAAIRMQERAGLDFVSDGEWRRLNYLDVIVDAVDGLQRGLIPPREFSTSTLPAVVSRLRQRSPLVAHSAEFLVKHAEQKTIVSVPSPHTIGKNFWSADHSREAYGTPEECIQDVIPIIRAEIQRLGDLGVDAIQIDEPWLASLANPAFRAAEGILDLDRELESNVAAINAVVEGIDTVPISVHVCGYSPTAPGSVFRNWSPLFDALGLMEVERFTLAFAGPNLDGFRVLEDFPEDKILGLGVLDTAVSRIELTDEIVDRAQSAMRYVPPERITLNSDCGFAPSARNRGSLDQVYQRLSAMSGAARVLRESHG
jgi:5-methyltetrahydropteroyltriglutamate--homocysteine methyltransferase